VPLFHRLAAMNALLVLVAVGVTIVVLVPGHESSYKIDEEGVVLLVALVLVVVTNLVLVRRVVRPLQQLTAVARTVDLDDPPTPIQAARPNSEAGELAVTFNEMLARLRVERREATGRVLAGQEAERLRIAQELHDQIGQELTAALLLLSRLESQAPTDLRSHVLEAQSAVRASLEDARRISIELRPEALDDLGLENALAVLCDRFAERSGLEVSCRIAERLAKLSPDVELVIYRVAQEALTNVLRHAAATEVVVELRRDAAHVVLEVADNGRGLPAEAGERGMRGMRERATVIDAELEVRARAEGGTSVLLNVPA
jgi:two-component system, NarL family, sensor histidine kinase UhpB